MSDVVVSVKLTGIGSLDASMGDVSLVNTNGRLVSVARVGSPETA